MTLTILSTIVFGLFITAKAAGFDEIDAANSLTFSRAAYCNISQIQDWTCGDACSARPSFAVEKVFGASPSSQRVTCFIGYEPSDRAIIVAFRGTSTPRRWVNALRVAKMKEHPDPACNCHVHAATYEEWMSISSTVLPTIDALLSKFHGARTIFTGHGLGGWFATLAAIDFASHYSKNFVVYTFGEPRLGDEHFASYASKVLDGKRFRVTNGGDVIALLPPKARGYRHFGQEVWFPLGANSPKICATAGASIDLGCSESADFKIPPGDDDISGLRDHLYYPATCMDCHCETEILAKKHGRDVARAIEAVLRQPNTEGSALEL